MELIRHFMSVIPSDLTDTGKGWRDCAQQAFSTPSIFIQCRKWLDSFVAANLPTPSIFNRCQKRKEICAQHKPKVLPIAWTRVETERWDPVTGRTHACTPDERGIVPSKMAAPLDGHCLRSFVGGYDTSQGSQTPDWTAFHWHSGDGINESVS